MISFSESSLKIEKLQVCVLNFLGAQYYFTIERNRQIADGLLFSSRASNYGGVSLEGRHTSQTTVASFRHYLNLDQTV